MFSNFQLEALNDHGTQLVNNNHFEAATVQQTLNDVVNRRGQVKDQSAMRNNKLNDSMLYAQFNRDVNEVLE